MSFRGDVFGYEHRKPEYVAKYPLARLPFVELDGEVLFESGAIMIFLAETFRAKSDLLPRAGERSHRDVLQSGRANFGAASATCCQFERVT